MARERVTIDVYRVLVDYGQGYEYETTEFTLFEARQRKREYRENCPEYPVKIMKTREPKTDYTAWQLADIALQVKLAQKAQVSAMLAKVKN